jgi:methyl-accepting chemotaxis protein
MRQWGIKKQLIALALLPVLLVATTLSGYFTYSQIQLISEALDRHGHSIASQIAPLSERAVITGNIRPLVPSLKRILSDPDIVSIRIINSEDETLVSMYDLDNQKASTPIWQNIIPETLLTYHKPITTQKTHLEDFDLNEKLATWESDATTNIIGQVELVLTSRNSDNEKILSFGKGGLISLAVLFLTILVALRISDRIAKPVQLLTNAVKKISAGKYETRIHEDAPTELKPNPNFLQI